VGEQEQQDDAHDQHAGHEGQAVIPGLVGRKHGERREG
jgi:hypothetical protein